MDEPPLEVSASPNRRNIVNRQENSVYFDIFVEGMPPNYTMPIRIGEPDPNQAISITFEGVPPGIEASGAVETGPDGSGGGRLTLTIVDPTAREAFDSLVAALGEMFPRYE